MLHAQIHPASACLRRADHRRRAGFTLVEILIVIAIIVVMLSLLVVGLNMATRASQQASSRVLMQSITQSLIRFKEDVGYLPPVLNNTRELVEGPDPIALSPADYMTQVQDWGSRTTLAEYLLGYGNHNQDGYGVVSAGVYEDENPPVGIRSPGVDGVWGAGIGPIDGRNPVASGRVYGPYLELDDPRLIAGLIAGSGENYKIAFRDEVETQAEWDAMPKVLVDYWGRPIEYFRRNYPAGAIKQSYRAVDYDNDGQPDRVPTLSAVVRLRPFEIDPGGATDVPSYLADARDDTTTTVALDSAEFALFSSGADKVFNAEYRYDVTLSDPDEDEELNRDNIVELGP